MDGVEVFAPVGGLSEPLTLAQAITFDSPEPAMKMANGADWVMHDVAGNELFRVKRSAEPGAVANEFRLTGGRFWLQPSVNNTYGLVRLNSAQQDGIGGIESIGYAAPPTPATNSYIFAGLVVNSISEAIAINESAETSQLTGLCRQLAADATNATTTMANLGLSVSVIAAGKYTGKLVLYCNNSLDADGAKFDFDGGTATMTIFRAHAVLTDTAAVFSEQVSALATDLAVATVTGDGMLVVEFTLVVNVAGTFIPRFAGNTAVSGTLTVYRGSYLELRSAA